MQQVSFTSADTILAEENFFALVVTDLLYARCQRLQVSRQCTRLSEGETTLIALVWPFI